MQLSRNSHTTPESGWPTLIGDLVKGTEEAALMGLIPSIVDDAIYSRRITISKQCAICFAKQKLRNDWERSEVVGPIAQAGSIRFKDALNGGTPGAS